MKEKISIVLLLSIFLSVHSWAQFQVIRASADANGQFRISGVKPGRYDLKASFIGYEESIISSVVVTAGKEVVLEVRLNENVSSLKEVEISGFKKHETEMGALTGLEAVAEGPFVKGKNASYMAAYRYSFTGLSQQLNIPIGTSATPFYQDLTFKVTSGDTKAGRFTLFGLGGLSHIQFDHNDIDTTDIFVGPNMDAFSVSTESLYRITEKLTLSASFVMTEESNLQ